MKITVKNTGTLLDILMAEFGHASKSKVRKLIKGGCISDPTGSYKHPETVLPKGTVLDYDKFEVSVKKTDTPFRILFEDEHLIAVIKPAGILTHGKPGVKVWSLHQQVNKYIKDESEGRKRAFVIHRLDREVTGIVLMAKTEEIQNKVKDNWKSVEKLYYAFVEGHPKEAEGTISSWLWEDGRQIMHSGNETPDSKFAVTHYKEIDQRGNNSLIRVKLETGRKNQIRVHMSDIGCPIVGDYRYGADPTIKRMIRLIAYSLTFPHPVTGKIIKLEIKMPRTFLVLSEDDEKYK
ncbi:MAG: RluA family pseudouridine synthase [Bacteroidota bacterium]|jgi:23S rRNA pseudouridine1911/1915/1917 synthase